jgi:hypothetical protein
MYGIPGVPWATHEPPPAPAATPAPTPPPPAALPAKRPAPEPEPLGDLPLRLIVLAERAPCEFESSYENWDPSRHRFVLPTGEPITALPGDVYIYSPHDADCPWENCDGRHLYVVLPVPWRRDWNIDSRANNCGLPADRTHRCWVRHGDPASGMAPGALHVDKEGPTCNAGAGSILIEGHYHGHLHNGRLTSVPMRIVNDVLAIRRVQEG